MLESLMLIIVVFGKYAIGMAVFIAVPMALAKIIIHYYRVSKWAREHDGCLVGSEEFYTWCRDNDVDPAYYV